MFVVQSLPRSGTHLLRTSINSHRELWCYGEIFNPNWKDRRQPNAPPAGISSIDDVIDHCKSQHRLTGFVTHAHVGLSPDECGSGIDDAFRCREDVRAAPCLWKRIPLEARVINLQRENLLARYVSHRIAILEKVWSVRAGQPLRKPRKLTIDCTDLLADFTRMETLATIADKRFPQAFRVKYEELVAEPSLTYSSILEFLRVAPRPLKPGTRKQGRPLAESIVNYDEVVQCLARTRYASFLEMPL